MALPLRAADVVDYSAGDDEPVVTRTYVSLPAAIRGERQRHGWRQTELAARLGVRREQVGRWEHGLRPEPDNVELLTDVLGLTLNEDGTVTVDGDLEEPSFGTPVVIVVVGTAEDAADVMHRLGLAPGSGPPGNPTG